MPLTDQTREEMRELMSKYPEPRSALLPMLHLVLASEGAVTPSGIQACAEELDMTPAEVSAGQPTVRIRGINVGGSRA